MARWIASVLKYSRQHESAGFKNRWVYQWLHKVTYEDEFFNIIDSEVHSIINDDDDEEKKEEDKYGLMMMDAADSRRRRIFIIFIPS